VRAAIYRAAYREGAGPGLVVLTVLMVLAGAVAGQFALADEAPTAAPAPAPGAVGPEPSAEASPDVLIIDFSLAMKTGPQTLLHLKRRWPQATILVLSGSREGQAIESARRAGADGYVLRNDQRAELFNAIRTLAQKKHYISTSVLELPAARPGSEAPHRRGTDGAGMLTSREQEVVALIAEGYRTREMAQLLSLSHKTVERHRTNLMRKLGVRSATGVVAYAITHGYIGF